MNHDLCVMFLCHTIFLFHDTKQRQKETLDGHWIEGIKELEIREIMKITEMWGFLLYRVIEMLARINSLKLLLYTL